MHRHIVLILLFAGAVFGQTLTCSPACSAKVNGTVTITASSAVSWSLASGSVGTLATIDSTHATYTAPSTLTEAGNVIGGCMVTPVDSVYNTRIDNLPVHSSSSTWLGTGYSGGSSNPTPAWDFNVIDNTTPLTPQYFYYGFASNGTNYQVPKYYARKREGGQSTNGNGDHHMVSVNHQTCQFYETYQDGTKTSNNTCSNQLNPSDGSGCTGESGATYNSASYSMPSAGNGGGSTDAAGLFLEPLTVRAAEIRSGVVNHALRWTTAGGYIYPGTVLWPGTTANGAGTSSSPPYGARMRLKASWLSAHASSYTAAQQVILTAWAHYGRILADATQGLQDTYASDVLYDPATRSVLSLTSFPADSSVWDFVDESSLMISATSTAANPGNGHVTIPNSALVKAGSASISIALLPVTMGVTEQYQVIQAGMTVTLPVWINNASNSSVTWAITTCSAGTGNCGSVVSGTGAYSAPSSVTAGSVLTATLTATSVQDPAVSTSYYLSLIPSGGIYISSGSSTSYGPDANGKTWIPDTGYQLNAYYSSGSPTYGTSWPYRSVTDYTLFETGIGPTGFGGDIQYGPFVVPNGNYKVTWYGGKGWNGSDSFCDGYHTSSAAVPSTYNWPGGGFDLATNNTFRLHNWDPGLAIGDACYTPTSVAIPAVVSNNQLIVSGLSWGGFGSNQLNPGISHLKIEPDATSPYWQIDTQGQSLVKPGATLQLGVVDWYTGQSNPTWGITGPGSISASGLYTAPSSQTVTSPVTVTATNGTYTATATLYVQGTQYGPLTGLH